MKYVLLILAGGTGVPVGVFLAARALVYRHADQHGRASAAEGEYQVATAEAARRAAQRDAGRDDLAAGINRALAARESAR